ncbi:hypothetical protein E1212_17675 [Jiangella ureilytica]|uniref:Ribosomal protein L7/L12 C-terminal domain-containing protein n=1 Tax=Jiangella ureilytica TaxID=2530374 RepID=A0A4R4RJY4_9ACTN|nr:hypothetical protein [Jiangella ureilytica]TDC49636.1 hypothetical protein E1212_17675 [Jiangella ureilytica]
MDFWLIVVIVFAAALVIGFGFVILRWRADAVRGPSASATSPATTATTTAAAAPARLDRETLDAAVGKLLAEGQVVPAVKLIRENTGLGLRQAMQYPRRLSDGADAANAAPAETGRSSISSEAMAHLQQLVAEGRRIQAIELLLDTAPELDLERAKEIVDRM